MATYVQKTGGTMTGLLTLDKIAGQSGKNYGYSLPTTGNSEGRIFFLLPQQTRGLRSTSGVSSDIEFVGPRRNIAYYYDGAQYSTPMVMQLKLHLDETVNENANTSDLLITGFLMKKESYIPFAAYPDGELVWRPSSGSAWNLITQLSSTAGSVGRYLENNDTYYALQQNNSDWNVSSGDAGGTTSVSGVVSNVIRGIQSQDVSIVLQHDIKGFSVDAVEQIVAWGLANGYTFLPMSESTPMVHQTPGN